MARVCLGSIIRSRAGKGSSGPGNRTLPSPNPALGLAWLGQGHHRSLLIRLLQTKARLPPRASLPSPASGGRAEPGLLPACQLTHLQLGCHQECHRRKAFAKRFQNKQGAAGASTASSWHQQMPGGAPFLGARLRGLGSDKPLPPPDLGTEGQKAHPGGEETGKEAGGLDPPHEN